MVININFDKYARDLIKFSKEVDEDVDDNMDMGMEKGKNIGIEQNQRDIVLNMFNKNLI